MSSTIPTHGSIAHVAINADDLDASRTFYERLFGWTFVPWGPPGFFQIETPGAPGIRAALQQRRELVDDRTTGFECTIAVDDVAEALARATATGGRIVMEPVTIPGVCQLAFVTDPSGNVLGIANYAIV